MFELSLPYRRAFRASLALLVVAAMAHCAWEGPSAAKQLAAAASCRVEPQPLPVSSEPDCHNESGCICRGATQVATTSVGHWRGACHDLLPPQPPALVFVTERCVRTSDADLLNQPPPAYGRHLRALYASLVI